MNYNTILLFVITSPEPIIESIIKSSKLQQDVTRTDYVNAAASHRCAGVSEFTSSASGGRRRGRRAVRLRIGARRVRSLHACIWNAISLALSGMRAFSPVRLVSSPSLWMVVMLHICVQLHEPICPFLSFPVLWTVHCILFWSFFDYFKFLFLRFALLDFYYCFICFFNNR